MIRSVKIHCDDARHPKKDAVIAILRIGSKGDWFFNEDDWNPTPGKGTHQGWTWYCDLCHRRVKVRANGISSTGVRENGPIIGLLGEMARGGATSISLARLAAILEKRDQ